MTDVILAGWSLHIAVVVYFDVRKVHGGGAQRVWGLCTSLARRGIQVTLLMNGSNRSSDSIVLQDGVECVSMRFVPLPAFLGPFSSNNPRISQDLNRRIRRGRIDIVQLEFPFMLPTVLVANPCAAPMILDAHGVEVDFWREVGSLVRPPVPAPLLHAIKLEERIAMHVASRIFACSRTDARRLAELYRISTDKLTVVPNFVMNETLRRVLPYRFQKKCILFMGSPVHLPNAWALKLIHEEIAPTLLKRNRELQFAFIGSNLPRWPVVKDMQLIGEVEDIRPYLQGATVCIAPIYQGSGTKVKVLDYLASKVAVVSTRKGVQGIDGIADGENIVIRDDIEEFEDAILELVEDEEKRLRIAQRGYELIEKNYNADVAADIASEVYEKLA